MDFLPYHAAMHVGTPFRGSACCFLSDRRVSQKRSDGLRGMLDSSMSWADYQIVQMCCSETGTPKGQLGRYSIGRLDATQHIFNPSTQHAIAFDTVRRPLARQTPRRLKQISQYPNAASIDSTT